MNFIDLKLQYLAYKDEIEQSIQTVLNSAQFIMGKEVGLLEEKLGSYVGVKNAIAVSSGTDALLLALMACGVKPGDEIITTPFTFIATAEVISLLGAKPVFVDIEEEAYCIDPAQVRETLERKRSEGSFRVKGIIAVSLYGQCADFDALNEIALSNGLFLLEDACQSFGATYKGRRSCSLSLAAATSFFPSKPLGCYGDGGMVFTDDDTLAEKIRRLRVHGSQTRYEHMEIGLNGRLDTLQAAILLAKFAHFEEEISLRQKCAAFYSEHLEPLRPAVITPVVLPYNSSVFAQYSIQVRQRDKIAEWLAESGIPTAVHYPKPLHMQKAFEYLNYRRGNFPLSEKVAGNILSLPMHPFLTGDEQSLVVSKLSSALASL